MLCNAVAVHRAAKRRQGAVGYGKAMAWRGSVTRRLGEAGPRHSGAWRCHAVAPPSKATRWQCVTMHSFGTAMLCNVQAQYDAAGLWQCTAVQRDGKVRRCRATAVRRKDMRRHSNAVLSAGMALRSTASAWQCVRSAGTARHSAGIARHPAARYGHRPAVRSTEQSINRGD